MENMYDDDSIDIKIEKLEAEESGLDYEVENAEADGEQEKEQPFDADKIRVDQQILVASMSKNSVLIIENPEAHLHPLSQSRLGKFLTLVAVNGVQIILETHSEHIVDGCRVQAVKESSCKDMKILFFEKKTITVFVKLLMYRRMENLKNGQKDFLIKRGQI